jgi:hypothetical protein
VEPAATSLEVGALALGRQELWLLSILQVIVQREIYTFHNFLQANARTNIRMKMSASSGRARANALMMT